MSLYEIYDSSMLFDGISNTDLCTIYLSQQRSNYGYSFLGTREIKLNLSGAHIPCAIICARIISPLVSRLFGKREHPIDTALSLVGVTRLLNDDIIAY